LRNFNARDRAKNFTTNQLQSILKEAEKKDKKIYITLNSLIKNRELPKLLDVLFLLSQTDVSAIIVQDLGVYYFLNKYFPKMKIHASTQMGFHNSIGVNQAKKMNFERVILARELTISELKKIKEKTNIQLELFVHGALCYSFSGMCLFSSYLGGMSANRGKCAQPCRRIYEGEQKADYFFSLKDIKLLSLLPEIMKIGISSLKIEGRMKSAEYVYRVAKAYRMAIDDFKNIPQAEELLKYDMGREKTQYFMGNSVSNAITENPFTGILLGEISSLNIDGFSFKALHPLKLKDRIRIQPQDGKNSDAIKIKKIEQNGDEITIFTETRTYKIGDKIFQIGLAEKKFDSKFRIMGKKIDEIMPKKRKQNILSISGSNMKLKDIQIYIRIDSQKWMRKIYLENFRYLILDFAKTSWIEFDPKKPFIQKYIYKIILQLPKFISEDEVSFYRTLCNIFFKKGITNFMISHISQLQIIPINSRIKVFTSENIYTMNDVAIQYLKENKIYSWVYPFELDFDNLTAGQDRKGIVPIYFYPELFYSRMPINLQKNGDYAHFKDRDSTFRKTLRNGKTIVVPQIPVSFLQYKNELIEAGFRRFLIDLSYDKPSQNTFNRVLKNFNNSKAEQPSTNFNFKSTLK